MLQSTSIKKTFHINNSLLQEVLSHLLIKAGTFRGEALSRHCSPEMETYGPIGVLGLTRDRLIKKG
jgi:hypothetical protein